MTEQKEQRNRQNEHPNIYKYPSKDLGKRPVPVKDIIGGHREDLFWDNWVAKNPDNARIKRIENGVLEGRERGISARRSIENMGKIYLEQIWDKSLNKWVYYVSDDGHRRVYVAKKFKVKTLSCYVYKYYNRMDSKTLIETVKELCDYENHEFRDLRDKFEIIKENQGIILSEADERQLILKYRTFISTLNNIERPLTMHNIMREQERISILTYIMGAFYLLKIINEDEFQKQYTPIIAQHKKLQAFFGALWKDMETK